LTGGPARSGRRAPKRTGSRHPPRCYSGISAHQLYLALKSANVRDEATRAAAEEVAESQYLREHLSAVRRDLVRLQWLVVLTPALLLLLQGAIVQLR
jgi:hypothetical protein